MPDLRYRPAELLVAIIGTIYDDPDPVPWQTIITTYSTRWPRRTVENAIYDLIAYGALHRTGRPAEKGRPDTRTLRPTTLGQAWLTGQLPPIPQPRNEHP